MVTRGAAEGRSTSAAAAGLTREQLETIVQAASIDPTLVAGQDFLSSSGADRGPNLQALWSTGSNTYRERPRLG